MTVKVKKIKEYGIGGRRFMRVEVTPEGAEPYVQDIVIRKDWKSLYLWSYATIKAKLTEYWANQDSAA